MDNEHPNEATAVPVGVMAPDFVLLNTDGRPHQLSAADTAVLLIFYRGDW